MVKHLIHLFRDSETTPPLLNELHVYMYMFVTRIVASKRTSRTTKHYHMDAEACHVSCNMLPRLGMPPVAGKTRNRNMLQTASALIAAALRRGVSTATFSYTCRNQRFRVVWEVIGAFLEAFTICCQGHFYTIIQMPACSVHA